MISTLRRVKRRPLERNGFAQKLQWSSQIPAQGWVSNPGIFRAVGHSTLKAFANSFGVDSVTVNRVPRVEATLG